jgi:heme exporter protein A
VGKVFGRQRALVDVRLTLRPGEITGLLGPNGAGKSTLVAILATLVRPSSGEVRYGDAAAGAPPRASIGLVAHDSHCYGDLSGRENLEFFARLYEVEAPAARARTLLERVALDGAAERPARTYSRGMLQRLAVARALVHRPALLLADEPFTGLDRAGVEVLAGLLAEERARGAVTLVVTHDFEAIAPLVDRVLVLARGRVVHDGAAPVTRSAAALNEVYQASLAGPPSSRVSPIP